MLCWWLFLAFLSVHAISARRIALNEWTPASEPILFTIHEPAWLQVVDYTHPGGNRFQVYDSGELLGVTSYVHKKRPMRGETASSPSEAIKYLDFYSRGIFELSPGSHRIAVKPASKRKSHVKKFADGAAVRLIKYTDLTAEIMLQHGARLVDIEHTVTRTKTEQVVTPAPGKYANNYERVTILSNFNIDFFLAVYNIAAVINEKEEQAGEDNIV